MGKDNCKVCKIYRVAAHLWIVRSTTIIKLSTKLLVLVYIKVFPQNKDGDNLLPYTPYGYGGKLCQNAVSVSPNISLARPFAMVPAMCFLTASGSTAVGVENVYNDPHYTWVFGGSGDIFISPVHGGQMDPCKDQTGPIAVMLYRETGVYQIHMGMNVWNGSQMIGATGTVQFTALPYIGATGYYNPGAPAGGNGLATGSAISSESTMRTNLRNTRTSHYFKSGTTFDITSRVEFTRSTNALLSGVRIGVYDGTANATIRNSGVIITTNVFNVNLNNIALANEDIVISNMTIDGNGRATACFNITQSVGAKFRHLVWDNCYFVNVTGLDGSNLVEYGVDPGTVSGNCGDQVFWNCKFDGGTTTSMHALIDGDQCNRYAIIGGWFSGGWPSANDTLDHYIYPSKFSDGLFRWIEFMRSNNMNYCMNLNCNTNAVSGAVLSDRFVIDGNKFSGTKRGLDGSNTNRVPAQGTFGNVIVQNNAFTGLGHAVVPDATANGEAMLYYNIRDLVFRDNHWFNNVPISGSNLRHAICLEYNGEPPTPVERICVDIYRNVFQYSTGIIANVPTIQIKSYTTIPTSGTIRDNIFEDHRSNCESIRLPISGSFAGTSFTMSNNLTYATVDTAVEFVNDVNGGKLSESGFKNTFGQQAWNVIYSGALFSAPYQGIFDPKTVGVATSVGATQIGDGATISVPSGGSIIRIYNIGDNLLNLASGAITSVLTPLTYNPTANGAIVINPNQFVFLGVGWVAGSVSIVSDESGSPFNIAISAASGGGGGGGGGGGIPAGGSNSFVLTKIISANRTRLGRVVVFSPTIAVYQTMDTGLNLSIDVTAQGSGLSFRLDDTLYYDN